MISLIIVEVVHSDTTDGLTEALFDLGLGSQLDPNADLDWPTSRTDGATWPAVTGGQDYQVRDYCVRVDVPATIDADSDIPSVEALYKKCGATLPIDLLDDPWRQKRG